MSGRPPRGRARTRSEITAQAEGGAPPPPPPEEEGAMPPVVGGRGRGQPPVETGRGRGFVATGTETTPSASTGGGSPPSSGASPTGSGSPTESRESPPQTQAPVPIGRAAHRGRTSQTSTVETVLVDPMTKVSLQEQTGERAQAQAPRSRLIESVPRTRPASAVNKHGISIKILEFTGLDYKNCFFLFQVLRVQKFR